MELKKIRALFLLYLFVGLSYTLKAQWTWVKGSNQTNATAVYGTQGNPASTNTPDAMYAPDWWSDQQGNTWVYSNSHPGYGVDYLWKYNSTTNMWTWLRGTGSFSGAVYGVQGVASPSNEPGGGTFQGATWLDLNGDLWLFGGNGFDAGDAMWRYTVATNEWTWMSGSNATGPIAPVFGIKNVIAPTNTPGTRQETSVTWTDASGNFWMIGGVNQTGSVAYADAWMYDVTVLQWVWKGGSNVPNVPPVYGIQGTPSLANHPMPGHVYGSWVDAAGNCYFFGGMNYPVPNGCSAIMWKYDPVLNQFTWVSGSTVNDAPGHYGTKCVPAINNYPSARAENRYATKDACGNFWLFGGGDNDLWKYKPGTNEWTWVSGGVQQGNSSSYGTIGISSPGNMPPPRFGGIMAFNKGIYIGLGASAIASASNGIDSYNDVWKYAPQPIAAFTSAPSPGSCGIQFTDQSTPECGGDLQSWHWDFGDGTTAIQQNPLHQYSSSGNFNVTLIVTNCLDITDTIQHSVQATAPFTSIVTSTSSACTAASGSATVTVSPPGNYTYSWSPVGGNSSIASNLGPGTYIVHIIDVTSGCGRSDTVVIASTSLVTLTSSFVNPGCTSPGTATVIPSGGAVPYTYLWSNAQTTQTATGLSNGTYSCIVTDANGCSSTTSVVLTGSNMPAATISCTPALCYGSNSGSLSAVISGGTAPYTYLWSNSQTTASITNLAAGSYNLNVTDANGCITIATATVVQPAKLILTPTVVATSCGLNNGSATVTVSGGTPVYTYLWQPGLLNTATINNLSAGTYTLIVSDVNTCTDTLLTIIGSSLPVQATFSSTATKGCAPLCVIFTNNTVPAGTSSAWSFGDGSTSSANPTTHCYNSPGTYNVSLTAGSQGCSNTLTLNNFITVSTVPHSVFTYLTYGGGDFDFIDQSIGAAQWLWCFGGNTSSNLQNPSHSYSTEQENIHNLVSLVVWDAAGLCKDSSSLLIDIHDFTLFVPNTISPNNDGLNDVFSPKGTGIKAMEFSVYDRWGLLLYKGDSLNSGWDGTFKGEKVQEDTYVYILFATDFSNVEHRKSGIVNVIK